ncbi:hypothetical protein [Chitinophaga sp. 212800010-3]|uniref:TlpA family protein disulfide reductase n=1 Tax=unclassified Chitinophaga TaxID=2619133 RepID=UPI002DF54AE6|nr:AhpC/TSA family protein [Chitinophaga sp. 212800010-3]
MRGVMMVLCCCVILQACVFRKKSQIPVFNILMPDSTTVFSTGKIPEGKVTMLVFFSPYCEHCQSETYDLIKHIDGLKEIHFYFISIEPISRIREFTEFYRLQQYSNIVVGQDYQGVFVKLSGLRTIPSSLVYDQHRQLRWTLKGEFNIDMLKGYLKEFK